MIKTRATLPGAFIAIMGMEACYLFLGLSLVRQHLGLDNLSLILVLLLYLLWPFTELVGSSFPVVARIINRFSLHLAVALAGVVLALAILRVLAADFPADGVVLLLVFCALAYWLGSSLVNMEISYRRVIFRVQTGILFLLIFTGAGLLLPAVIFCVLAVSALTRVRWETTLSRSRGVLQTFPFWRVMLASAAVLVIASLVFLAVSPDMAGSILLWLATAYNNLIKWWTAFLSFPFWHEPLVKTDDWQLSCLRGIPDEPEPAPKLPDQGAIISPVFTWIIGGALCLALLVLIVLAIRKLRTTKRKVSGARRVSFETGSIRVNILHELLILLQGLLKWLGRLMLFLLKQVGLKHLRAKPEEAVTSVRAIYRNLLQWAADRDVYREHSQTAIELLDILRQRFPQEAGQLALITGVYLKARYSNRPVTGEEFETIKEAWQRVKLAV